MLLRLGNAARGMLVLVAFLLAVTLSFFSIRSALAAHDAGLETQIGYERAAQLEPGNFENWYLLGRYWQYALEQPDSARALSAYQAALARNPQSSDVWLDLAALYESEDRIAEAQNAFLQAKKAYPLSAEVSWRYGNFLLRRGAISQAYAEIRRTVYVDPRRSAEAFSRCWRVNPDAQAILDDVLAPDRDGYLDVIRELADQNQLPAALVVWGRLVAIQPRLQLASVLRFMEMLLQQRRFDDAARVWQQAVRLSTDPPTGDPPGSALWDGGFETNVRGGLGWFFSAPPRGVTIGLDTREKHSGRRSLRLDFDGKHNIAFAAVCNNPVVQPATPYLLSAWVHTQRLTTDQGIRMRLSWTENSRSAFAETPDVRGSEPWRQIQMPWTSPADGRQLRVCVVRDTSGKVDSQIQGTAWVDDVSLVPQPRRPQP
jgi:hypothetical protein